MNNAGPRATRKHLSLLVSMAALAMSGAASSAHAAADLSRLESLLSATPEGGWVKASIGTFSDSWATDSTAVPLSSYRNPGSIVSAWSSFAWDSTRGDLLLWGGGHANYAGNEMYVWDGETGNWNRGSLASRLDANNFVVDSAAPQSSHTYDNNLYLPVNGLFLTLGGAAFQSGAEFKTFDGTTVSASGPWLWDPSKADPNKVGGTTGSGWDPSSVGGEMWINRIAQTTGNAPGSFVNAATAYRTENGKDVVYVSTDKNASGFPSLYRYTLGDVKNGGLDTWEKIGEMFNSATYAGTGTIDTKNNLFIRTTMITGQYTSNLAVWDLSKSNPANPSANLDIGIRLVDELGNPFLMTPEFAVEYDSATGQLLLWDGSQQGTVWTVTPTYDANGKLLPTWVVKKLISTSFTQPGGDFSTGVFGKLHYIDELDAFMALNEFSPITGDAEVWLYKPFSNTTTTPPNTGGGTGVGTVDEPNAAALLLASLGILGLARRRREARN